jgi:hypothetical protein
MQEEFLGFYCAEKREKIMKRDRARGNGTLFTLIFNTLELMKDCLLKIGVTI